MGRKLFFRPLKLKHLKLSNEIEHFVNLNMGLRNQFSEHFQILLYMNLVPSTTVHVHQDKCVLFKPKDLRIRPTRSQEL